MRKLITNDPSRVGTWICARAGGVFAHDGDYAIGVEKDGDIVGGVMYNSYYFRSVFVHAAFATPFGSTKELLVAAFDYPFNQLKVEKLVSPVQEDNKASRKLTEHLGFILETRIKNACVGGDLLLYSMTRDQCRFLGEQL